LPAASGRRFDYHGSFGGGMAGSLPGLLGREGEAGPRTVEIGPMTCLSVLATGYVFGK
jgi:hypothetical protein